jgi:excisionase family DNA binding protein
MAKVTKEVSIVPGRYYRVPAVAQHFDVSQKCVWSWIYSGKLGSVVVGGSRRISAEAIEKFVEGGK